MKTIRLHSKMGRFFLLGWLLITTGIVKAQIVLTDMTQLPNWNADSLVRNVLMDQGVSISNVKFNGSSDIINCNSIGVFNTGDAPTNIGIQSGIIIASGGIQTAIGPNNNNGQTIPTTCGEYYDGDLASIASGSIYDVAVLEFDFIPWDDTIQFRIVFGSEEYMEYVGAGFNDVFGFFVDGINPEGGVYEHQNVALIPGTSEVISIDNVNLHQNSNYYIDNTGGETIQFDGFTTVLEMNFKVVPLTNYHIKMAICDVGDSSYDSGVFLEAHSFSSNFSYDMMINGLSYTEIPEGYYFCSNQDIEFNTLTSLSFDDIIWYFGDGTFTQGANVTHSYNQNGVYTITNVLHNPHRDTDSLFLSKEIEIRSFESEEEIEICDSSYLWNGHFLTQSGFYSDTLVSSLGCDSILSLYLTIDYPSTLGDFTYMTPTNNYPFTSFPIEFSWDAVENAQHYDLYLWNANDPMPEEPYVSGLTNGFYRCTSLPNNQTYQWYVKAYNPCDAITSNIRSFTVNVEPAINVSMTSINFGEVSLNQSASITFNIDGVALEESLNIEITGENAGMFSFNESTNWNSLTGGNIIVTFWPTMAQYTYHANLVVSSGTLTQNIVLSGSLADYYVFHTYVDEDVYPMNNIIPIHGDLKDANGNAVSNAEVEIGVFVMGMKRCLQATTDMNGEFTVDFEPMASESGYYTVNSGYVGNHSTAIHDDFNIPGMSVIANEYILCAVTQNQPRTDTIRLRNKSNLPLNNIQVSVLSAPEGCSINCMPLSLGGLETNNLVYTINGTELTQGNQYQEIKLRAISNEGAATDFSIWYYCMEPKGILNVTPNSIATTMTKGKSKIVDVLLSNHGTSATGEIALNLPEVEWLSVVGNTTLPSIAVNDSAFFSLRLSPDKDFPLGQYSGAIAINCEHGEFASLPYQITAVSDSTGTLVVDVTDEYTWNTNGGFGPHLANAEVTLTGYFSLETVAHGYTNENGLFNVEQLPEGYYRLHVNADRHSEYDNVILIEAGAMNQKNVFVQYQGVTYSWEVIPTEIQDEYTYELNVVYETNVPVPVITIDYTGIHDLEYGESANCNLIFTNHGLISAYETQIYFSHSDEYTFIPLFDHIDTLHAQTTVVVPCYYYRSENEAKASSDDCDIHCLSVSIYYCNNERQLVPVRSKPFPLGSYEICYPEQTVIPILPPWEVGVIPEIPWIYWEDCPGCPPISFIPQTTEQEFCTPCLDALAKAIAGCLPNPYVCGLINAVADYHSGSSFERSLLDQLSCVITELAKDNPIVLVLSCLYSVCSNLSDCIDIEFHDNPKSDVAFIQYTINDLYYSSLYFANELSLAKSFFPEDVWDDEENIVEFLDEIKALTNATTGFITEDDAQQLASSFVGTSITYNDIIAFINRWNRSLDYWSNGYYMISDLPTGYDTDFVQIDADMINEMFEVENYYSLSGYENMAEVYSESLENANTIIDNTSQSNVCASVTVQFSQKMTMTREAFEGTFNVHNGHDLNAMEGIGLNFVVKDENGNNSTDLFQINTTSLTNITAIDGSGSLGAGMDGTAKILFIPTKQAAPTEPKVYYFGGTFSFIDPYTSEEFEYELYPVDLTVHPSPDLYVDYFMQRDILGDDALTLDKVEPSIPAELGVIINNKGAGVAKNVILETAEPKIIDNDKGLAIDFAMYGASFNGNEAQLGLMSIPFGNIDSDHTAVGEWLFTSSLLGHFVSYEAHVIHNNSYGNPNLSLVSHLDIHELIHPIRAYGNLDDGINDFLVNDVPDFHDYPDSIYFSNGGKTGVSLFNNIHFNHYVQPYDTIVTLTVNPSSIGWNYGLTDDPGTDKYELVSCTRNIDNQIIPLNNIWQTFVTLQDQNDPIYENKLHIVDTLSNNNQNYTYTLVYTLKKNLLAVEEITGIPNDFIEYPLESFSVKFNRPIADSTFTYEDMTLKCNNGSNLMNSSVIITKLDDDLFNVNISGLTFETGYYVLNIHTLNINDAQGYNGYDGKQATWIQVLNGANFVYINEDQTTCENDTFEPLTSIVVGTSSSLQWMRNGTQIEGANNSTYQPVEAGIYTLCVTFENGEVLTSNEVTLTAHPSHQTLITEDICEGEDYSLNGFNLTNLPFGIYEETLYYQNVYGCDSIISLHLTVHESINVHIIGDTIVEAGQSITLFATGAEYYEWSTGETTASITVSPAETTTYSVVGTNSHGCSDSDAITVTIGHGIHEESYQSTQVYPNPVRDKLFIQSEQPFDLVEVYSLTGTLLYRNNSSDTILEIPTQNLCSGMYFIRLITGTSVETKTFVKE